MVVSSLKQLYGLRYIYCWHGLSAYWSGVSADPKELGVAKYNATLRYSQVCPAFHIIASPALSASFTQIFSFSGEPGHYSQVCPAFHIIATPALSASFTRTLSFG